MAVLVKAIEDGREDQQEPIKYGGKVAMILLVAVVGIKVVTATMESGSLTFLPLSQSSTGRASRK